jgi:hypothetical protein
VFYQHYPTAQPKQSFTTKLYRSNKAWEFRPKQKNLQHISNSRLIGVVKKKAHINMPDFQDMGAIRAFLPPHFTNGGAHTYTKPQSADSFYPFFRTLASENTHT